MVDSHDNLFFFETLMTILFTVNDSWRNFCDGKIDIRLIQRMIVHVEEIKTAEEKDAEGREQTKY